MYVNIYTYMYIYIYICIFSSVYTSFRVSGASRTQVYQDPKTQLEIESLSHQD